MARKPNATVCGLPVYLAGPIVDYEERVRLGTGPLGHRRTIGKSDAQRVAESVGSKLPGRGQTIKLCKDLTLERSAYVNNEFYVRKSGSGDISGSKRRR